MSIDDTLVDRELLEKKNEEIAELREQRDQLQELAAAPES